MDEDVVYRYDGILLGHKKRMKYAFAATWMDPDIIILSEAGKKENNKYHMISLIYRI